MASKRTPDEIIRAGRERDIRNRESRLKTMREYDRAHRAEHRARDKKRHYATKKTRNAESRAWRAKNLERARAYDRKRYAENREKRLAIVNRTAARYPDRVAANKASYRARKRAAKVPLTINERADVTAFYA